MIEYIKKNWYRYFMVALGCLIMGVALNVFYMPNKLISGGISGIAVLGYYIAGLPMGITNLACNIPLFFLAYKCMNRDYTVVALFGTLVFSFSLDFFSFSFRAARCSGYAAVLHCRRRFVRNRSRVHVQS